MPFEATFFQVPLSLGPSLKADKGTSILNPAYNNPHAGKSLEQLKQLVSAGDLDACIEVLRSKGVTTFSTKLPFHLSADKQITDAVDRLRDSSSPAHEGLGSLIKANIDFQQREYGLAAISLEDYNRSQDTEKSYLVNSKGLVAIKDGIKAKCQEGLKERHPSYVMKVQPRSVLNDTLIVRHVNPTNKITFTR